MRLLPVCVVLVLLLCGHTVMATKHNFAVHQDGRTFIGPIGTPYGFREGGHFGFDIFDYKLEVGPKHQWEKASGDKQKEILKDVEAGFLLKRFDSESAFTKYHDAFASNWTRCSFSAFRAKGDGHDGETGGKGDQDDVAIDTAGPDGIFLPLQFSQTNSTWQLDSLKQHYVFKKDEAGLYVLIYQVCSNTKEAAHAEVRSTFEIDFHYVNKDTFGHDSFLTAGEMLLPTIYLYFFFSYAACAIIWILNIRGIQRGREGCFAAAGAKPVVYPIHHLMSALIVLKTITVLFESVRYHYIRFTGHAEFWTVVYYSLTFLKGVFLFTVILLIGSGWSYLKPVLSDREKKMIFAVMVLQVIDNIALVVMSTETVGESIYEDWRTVLHLVDLVCCCLVLFPIVWQVSTLERAVEHQQADAAANNETDDQNEGNSGLGERTGESTEEQRTLSRLRKFRGFYLLVVGYIYFTRIAVYLFSTMLDYEHTWVRYFVTELATLGFYAITGLHMRPVVEHAYLALARQDDAVEEIEMG